MTRPAPRFGPSFALSLAASLLLACGCISTKCYKDADCPSGKFCDSGGECVDKCESDGDCAPEEKCVTTTGRCVVPYCLADDECEAETRCLDYACVPWCDDDEDCLPGRKCYANNCVPLSTECNCPAAPVFCKEDINPQSSTEGFSVCVPDSFEGGVLLFFGSIFCSHCRHLFEKFLEFQEELLSEGQNVRAIFVHIRQYEAGNDDVAQLLDGFTDPVVHDTEEDDIWGRYNADWYHVVIVDPYGCLAYHAGPLSQLDAEGDLGQEIKQKWKETLHAECIEIIEPSPEPGDLVEQSDIGDESDIGDVPDLSVPDVEDAVPDEAHAEDIELLDADDLPAPDQADAPDVGPDVSMDVDVTEPEVVVCQIAGAAPIEPGDKVPDFTCEDLNPNSETSGQPVTDDSLKGVVWLAYYGTCT